MLFVIKTHAIINRQSASPIILLILFLINDLAVWRRHNECISGLDPIMMLKNHGRGF